MKYLSIMITKKCIRSYGENDKTLMNEIKELNDAGYFMVQERKI